MRESLPSCHTAKRGLRAGQLRFLQELYVCLGNIVEGDSLKTLTIVRPEDAEGRLARSRCLIEHRIEHRRPDRRGRR